MGWRSHSLEIASRTAGRCASLTRQQAKILELMSQGLLNKQIAYELGIAESTVKVHTGNICRRLGNVQRTIAITGWIMSQLQSGKFE